MVAIPRPGRLRSGRSVRLPAPGSLFLCWPKAKVTKKKWPKSRTEASVWCYALLATPLHPSPLRGEGRVWGRAEREADRSRPDVRQLSHYAAFRTPTAASIQDPDLGAWEPAAKVRLRKPPPRLLPHAGAYADFLFMIRRAGSVGLGMKWIGVAFCKAWLRPVQLPAWWVGMSRARQSMGKRRPRCRPRRACRWRRFPPKANCE